MERILVSLGLVASIYLYERAVDVRSTGAVACDVPISGLLIIHYITFIYLFILSY